MARTTRRLGSILLCNNKDAESQREEDRVALMEQVLPVLQGDPNQQQRQYGSTNDAIGRKGIEMLEIAQQIRNLADQLQEKRESSDECTPQQKELDVVLEQSLLQVKKSLDDCSSSLDKNSSLLKDNLLMASSSLQACSKKEKESLTTTVSRKVKVRTPPPKEQLNTSNNLNMITIRHQQQTPRSKALSAEKTPRHSNVSQSRQRKDSSSSSFVSTPTKSHANSSTGSNHRTQRSLSSIEASLSALEMTIQRQKEASRRLSEKLSKESNHVKVASVSDKARGKPTASTTTPAVCRSDLTYESKNDMDTALPSLEIMLYDKTADQSARISQQTSQFRSKSAPKSRHSAPYRPHRNSTLEDNTSTEKSRSRSVTPGQLRAHHSTTTIIPQRAPVARPRRATPGRMRRIVAIRPREKDADDAKLERVSSAEFSVQLHNSLLDNAQSESADRKLLRKRSGMAMSTVTVNGGGVHRNGNEAPDCLSLATPHGKHVRESQLNDRSDKFDRPSQSSKTSKSAIGIDQRAQEGRGFHDIFLGGTAKAPRPRAPVLSRPSSSSSSGKVPGVVALSRSSRSSTFSQLYSSDEEGIVDGDDRFYNAKEARSSSNFPGSDYAAGLCNDSGIAGVLSLPNNCLQVKYWSIKNEFEKGIELFTQNNPSLPCVEPSWSEISNDSSRYNSSMVRLSHDMPCRKDCSDNSKS